MASAAPASAAALTLNLVTATLGSGILSLPWATAGASLLPAAGITCLVLALNAATNVILVLAAERAGVYDLGALLGRLPGRLGPAVRGFCDASIWCSVFLCLVGYLIVVAEALASMLPRVPWTAAVALGALVVLPLCFLDQAHLAFSSGLSIAANVFLFVLLLATFFTDHGQSTHGRCCLLGLGRGSVTMVSALMQAAIVQMCVLPMYEQLERRSVKRFVGCVAVAFCFVAGLFIAFSYVAYASYGPGVSSNVLDDLPQSALGQTARVGMAVAVLGVYPLLLTSMIAPIRHAEQRAARRGQPCHIPSPGSPSGVPLLGPEPGSGPRGLPAGSSLATLLVVACSALAAHGTRDLGRVNILNGALQVAGLVGLAPGLAGLRLLGRRGLAWRAAMLALMALGLLMSALGLAFTDNYVAEVQAACVWPLHAGRPVPSS